MFDARSAAKLMADTTAPALRASFIIRRRPRCLRRRDVRGFNDEVFDDLDVNDGMEGRGGIEGRDAEPDPFRRAEATPAARLEMAPAPDRRDLDRPPFDAPFPNAATRAVGIAAALVLLFFMGTPFSCVPP